MKPQSAMNNQQEQAQNVSIVALKTGDGRHVGSQSTYEAHVIASESATDLFELTELISGGVALKSVISGKYLSAHPEDGLAARCDQIGPAETFNPIQSDGKVAFQLSDGIHYLSVQPGYGEALTASAVSIGPNELFSTEQVILDRPDDGEESPEAHGCCGPRRGVESVDSAEAGLVWKEWTHLEIVGWALHLMRTGLTPEAREMIEFWDKGPGFSEQLKKGLRDADKEWPWRGTNLGLSYMFNDHFYSPETELNYMNQRSSAVTEGRRYFNLSVHVGMRIVNLKDRAPAALYARAGYYLGLSLHFLTDLTQPMHAANFANVFARSYPMPNMQDLRHKGFEEYADQRVKGGYFNNYPPLKPEDLDLSKITDVTSFLKGTARTQKDIFDKHVKPEVDKKLRFVGNPKVPIFDNKWGAEADPALEAALKPAPKVVARYLAYWARCIKQPLNIDAKHWYKIVEPTKGEVVRLLDEHFRRWEDTGDDCRFYFLFNADGTCSLACKAYKANPWFLYRYWTGAHRIGEYKNASGTPDAWSRFRVVPTPDGKVWFFEPSLDEVVGVGSDGYLVRWNPCEEQSQLFTLKSDGPISGEDEGEIKQIWPYYDRDMPWWGKD